MKPVTQGERLFLLLKDEVFDSIGQEELNWANARSLFLRSTGHDDVSDYVRGSIAIFCLRTMLRYWEEEKASVDTNLHLKHLGRFVRDEVFPGVQVHLSERIARQVIEAERCSGKAISSTVKTEVLMQKLNHHCYLCGTGLTVGIPQGSPGHLTLEHIWPSCIGGDSIAENLIPACEKCQNITEMTASWEWVNVQNLMLSSKPSAQGLLAVNNKYRYARHYKSVIETTSSLGLTMKEGFIKVGPMKPTSAVGGGHRPISFFEISTS